MEQSIFNSELTPISNNHIFSAARWSRFLGIVFLLFAGILFVFGLLAYFFSGEEFAQGFKSAFEQNGTFIKYPWLVNFPGYVVVLAIVLTSALAAYMGYLFFSVGKNGIAYYNSQDENAFIKTFEKAKQIFLISSIISGLGILFTLITLFI